MTNDSKIHTGGTAGGESLPPPSPPPPHGPRLRILLVTVLVLVAGLIVGAIFHEPLEAMVRRLLPAGGEAAKTALEAAAKPQYYTCGMHPWVVLPKPGDCPICHMKLVPLDPAKFSGEVTVNPLITQSIGVRVSPVVTGPVTRVIRTVGNVDYNETLVRDVNLKISGWVEKLYVNTLGQPVEKDQPLLEIYSPDLYSAQEEYLLAFKKKEALGSGTGPMADMASLNADLLESARKRLEYFDISDAQVRELEKSGKASKTMTLRSPFRGTVVLKNVFEGQRVESGMQLLRVADLSKLWIMATIYEYQLPYIEVGQKAAISLPYIPGQTFEGKITYVYPYLNQELRQAKVRLELDNPGLVLKPGMFATVELRRTLAADRTLVPREAVIDTGERQIAFVSLGEGRFDPRKVTVGVEAEGGMLEILDGLKPGELVVTSGEFLLDSEARLREALAKMVKGTPAAGQQTQAAVAGTGELTSLPEPAAKALTGILDAYFQIGAALANDSVEGLAAPARQIAGNADALVKVAIPEDEHFWHKHVEAATVGGKAQELIETKDPGQARERFADLSVALGRLIRATGVPPTYGKEVQELHCPMYREKQGGTIWLQPAGEVRNPYYGKSMLGCFDTKAALPVTGAKPAGPPAPPSPAKPGAMPPMPGM
jgi:RND family efflux transporter MFP subunit